MKTILPLFVILFASCSTATKWQSQLAPDSIANDAIVSVAKHYGGQSAAELASAGLYATADVLQGYVDKKPPLDIIVESPGVEGVGRIALEYLKKKNFITQETVNKFHKAAAFAARLTYKAPEKSLGDNKRG